MSIELSNSALHFSFIISSTFAIASSESIDIPKAATISASAVNPSPVLLPSTPVFNNNSHVSLSTALIFSGSSSESIFDKILPIASFSKSTKSSINLCPSYVAL